MTVDQTEVTGGDLESICGNDRSDVRALKSIINTIAISNPDSISVPVDSNLTGKDRAETFLEIFKQTIDTWDASSDTV